MKVLFDTNVLLDLLLTRQPYQYDAAKLNDSVVLKQLCGLVSVNSVTTLAYFARKALGKNKTVPLLKTLLSNFELAYVDRLVIDQAKDASEFDDFEDAVLYFSGLQSGATAIVTRDRRGFKNAKIPVYAPKELLSAIQPVSFQ